MQDFKMLPDERLLRIWAHYSGDKPIHYLTQTLQQAGYRIYTKNSPFGRDLTRLDVARRLRRAQRRHTLYPVGRPATPADLDRIAVSVITQYSDAII